MKPVVFYVSGHGFGHASRDIEVINALLSREPALPIVVRTAAKRWLFDLTLHCPVDFHQVECDTGIVQIDSLHLDEKASIDRAADFHNDLAGRSELEARFLRSIGAGLVVGDIPPLAFAAASRAGVPSIALGNFTWDWIYEEYSEALAGAPALLPAIREAYKGADLALRLPLCGPFDVFREVVDLPFIARHARRSPSDVRQALGLDGRGPVLLLSFGGYGLRGLDGTAVAGVVERGCTVMTTDQAGSEVVAGDTTGAVVVVDEVSIYDRGFRYEDLVAASDAVLTKPGYGVVAECIANDTGILYTPRGRFREYAVLVEGIRRHTRNAFLSHEDLYGGRWWPRIEEMLARPAPLDPPPPTDGAERAADIILGFTTP